MLTRIVLSFAVLQSFTLPIGSVVAEDHKLFDAIFNTPTTGQRTIFAETEIWLSCQAGDSASIYTPESEGGSVIVNNAALVNGINVCRFGDQRRRNFVPSFGYRCFNRVLGGFNVPMQEAFVGIGTIHLPVGNEEVIPLGVSQNRFELEDWARLPGGSYGNTTLWLRTSCQLVEPSDLALTAIALPDSATAGFELTYLLRVENLGPTEASRTLLNYELPVGVEFLRASPSQGDCSFLDRQVACELGRLAAGEWSTVEIVTSPTTTGVISSTFTIGAADLDPELSNNSFSTEITAAPPEIAYFAQFGKGANQLGSQIFLFNGDQAEEVNARIFLRGQQGEQLNIGLNGEPVEGDLSATIPPSALRIFQTDRQGPITAGSVAAYSDGPLHGVIVFGGAAGVAGVSPSQPLSGGFLAPIESRRLQGVNTGIAVRNLADVANELHLTLLDSDGVELSTARLSQGDALAPSGQASLFVNEFDWRPAVDWTDFRGLLKVASSEAVAATVIQTHPGELATMPVAPLPETAASSETHSDTPAGHFALHFSHFGNGAAGNLQLFSRIILINPDPSRLANADVTLHADSGGPLRAKLNGEQVDGRIGLQIPPQGMRMLETDGQGEVQAGSVRVSSDVALAGVILFGGSAGFAGVGAGQPLETGFVAPVQSNHALNINTGVALMNLEEQAATLDLTLLSEHGEALAEARLAGPDSLPARGHLALFVDEFEWDRALDFANFKGLMRVNSSGRIAATVLQTRAGQFATMAVAAR